MGRARIGTSGYQYDHWRGILYPPDLPKRLWLEHYAREFDTVEVNNTFYRLPGPNVFDHWYEEAPKGFLYALKFSQYGTHRKRLKDPENTVPRFTTMADRLKGHLGPILVQLPPRWDVNVERLEAFLHQTPRRYRWAVEVRDARWLDERVYAVLRTHGVALCLHDMLPNHPRVRTANWVYLRFHGGEAEGGSYSPAQIHTHARFIREALQEGADVYAYFNNDQYGHAVHNARELRALVGA